MIKKNFSKIFACSAAFLFLFSLSISLVNAKDGTCKNPNGATYCGQKSGVSNCYCDEACTGYNDCCTDYNDTCVNKFTQVSKNSGGGGGSALCGNGIKGEGEECDGLDFGGKTCQYYGGKGNLKCTANCQIDTSSCITTQPSCGNGKLDPNEQCDISPLGDILGPVSVCTDYSQFVGGTLKCSPSCTIDTSSCITTQPSCGNGICEEGEANYSYCPPCVYNKENPCKAPCEFKQGTCPQDCTQTEVKEQVKCVFQGSNTEQTCSYLTYPGTGKGSCTGLNSCVAAVSGKKYEQVEWKSTCGGVAYTTIDGVDEYAYFNCGSNPKITKQDVINYINNNC